MSEEKEYHYKCSKCGFIYRLQGTKEQIEKWLNQKFFDCKGFHMELGSPIDYLEYIKSVEISERAKSSKEILNELMEKFEDSDPNNWFLLGAKEKAEELGILCLHDIKDLHHLGFGTFGNNEFIYNRIVDISEGRIHHREKR